MSSVVCVAAVGNHDIDTPKPRQINQWGRYPDLLGFFCYWAQPRNGPVLPKQPPVYGKKKWSKLSAIVGADFTTRTNFSFDYGDAHWLILDGNKYVDWGEPQLKQWVEQDLKRARTPWKFVVVHQPGFSNDPRYYIDQHMRVLSETFEENGVTLVFSGHCHYYHASKPLRFKMSAEQSPIPDLETWQVAGEIEVDENFDGKRSTVPQGVIYVVTGSGGKLIDQPMVPSPTAWTHKQVAHVCSVTVLDVSAAQLTVRQVSEDGSEVDRFVISKPKASGSQRRACKRAIAMRRRAF
jgi:hypothetical protein